MAAAPSGLGPLERIPFQILASSVPDAFLVVAAGGEILFANSRAAEAFGYPLKELVGREVDTLVPERFRGSHRELREGFLARPNRRPMGSGLSILARRKDGSEFPADIALNTLVVGGDTLVTCTVRDMTERARVEEAVRSSERLLHSTLDSLSSHIAVLDPSGRIVAVNAAWRRFAEENSLTWPDHGVGRSYLEVCERAQGLPAAFEAAARIREVLSGRSAELYMEYECHGPKGRRWFAARGTPLKGNGVTGMVVAHEDITERRRSEEEAQLLQSVAIAIGESGSLHDALAVVVRKVCEATGWICGEAWVPNPTGVYLERGPFSCAPDRRLEEFCGASRAYRFPKGLGLPGRAWLAGAPVWVQDVTADEAFYRRALAHGAGLRAGLALPVLAGREAVAVLLFFQAEPREEDRRFLALASALAAQIGAVIHRKRAEDTLHRSQELLEAIMDNSAVVIYVKDAEGRYLHINRRFEALFHVARDAFRGKTDRDLFSREVVEQLRRNDEEVLKTGSPLSWEEVVPQDDGPHTYISVKFPLREASGAPYAVCGMSTDITERKRAEEDLRRAKAEAEVASKAKSLFLANMSHEMRTPLNAVIGLTDLVLQAPLSPDQRDSLDAAKESAIFLNSLISDVLDFANMQSGALRIEAVPFGLRQSLTEALKPLALRASQKRLELVWSVAPDVPERLVGDERRLLQVLVNLADNAVKFTDAGGVDVSAALESRTGEKVVIRFLVSDTGIGIVRDKRLVIFEEFTQADPSPTRKYGGIGLGLTIASRLVEMMGGRIWLESEEGKGSRFHFTVPFGVE